jgi:hypothetical protein
MILLSMILRVFPLAHPIHTSYPQKQGMIQNFRSQIKCRYITIRFQCL